MQLRKKKLKILSIELKDLAGLSLRVYERKTLKDINSIIFYTPKIHKYLDEINSFIYITYYENKYGDITKNQLRDLMLNFGTDKHNIKVAFYDNYGNGIKQYFDIKLPIKLLDFIEKLFDHFDNVKLIGYPDNGGIDGIIYDQVNDIYLIQTWS